MNKKEKKEINVGDFVRVWKPANVREYPFWLEDDEVHIGMDEFDGKVVKIKDIDSNGDVDIEGDSGWIFSSNWLTLTNNPDLDIEWIK